MRQSVREVSAQGTRKASNLGGLPDRKIATPGSARFDVGRSACFWLSHAPPNSPPASRLLRVRRPIWYHAAALCKLGAKSSATRRSGALLSLVTRERSLRRRYGSSVMPLVQTAVRGISLSLSPRLLSRPLPSQAPTLGSRSGACIAWEATTGICEFVAVNYCCAGVSMARCKSSTVVRRNISFSDSFVEGRKSFLGVTQDSAKILYS